MAAGIPRGQRAPTVCARRGGDEWDRSMGWNGVFQNNSDGYEQNNKIPQFNLLNYVYEFKTHRFQSEQKTNYPIPRGEPITTYNYTQLIVPNLSRIH